MADKKKKVEKDPGRIKQLWQVLNLTRKTDKLLVPILILTFLAPLGAGITVALLLSGGSVLTLILYIVTGLLLSVLVTLIILGQRAEKAAYKEISGKPGAVGAVLRSALRRTWQASEFPVAVNPRTQEAVYRAVGETRCCIDRRGLTNENQKDARRRTTLGLTGDSRNSRALYSRRDRRELHPPL